MLRHLVVAEIRRQSEPADQAEFESRRRKLRHETALRILCALLVNPSKRNHLTDEEAMRRAIEAMRRAIDIADKLIAAIES